MRELLKVLFEDEDLLVVNKPAGLVCHPTKGDEYSSLISRLRLYCGEGCRPQMINRLDRETSGVTVVGKNEEATRAVGRLWEGRQVFKEYVAIVHGWPKADAGMIDAPMGKDEGSRVAIKDRVREDGAPARTEYWVERRWRQAVAGLGEREFSLVRVVPQTGRKHQIRIHLAHIGHAIVGDKLYGANEDWYLGLVEDRLREEDWRELILRYHALHAREVRFEWRGARRFVAEQWEHGAMGM